MELTKVNTRAIYDIYCKKTKNPVTYEQYKYIIQELHKKISDKILDGYKYNPLIRVGFFQIVLNYRKKRSEKYIDWGKSNKRKAEILARGGTLYSEYWEHNGVILEPSATIPVDAVKKNNGGEKWVIHYNDTFYLNWAWGKDSHSKRTKNITRYSFVPTRANKRAIGKIFDRTPDPELIYGINRKESK